MNNDPREITESEHYLPTIWVYADNGKPMRMNRSVYDAAPDKWKLVDAPPAANVPGVAAGLPVGGQTPLINAPMPAPAPAPASAPPIPSSTPRYYVATIDGKYLVTDKLGTPYQGLDMDGSPLRPYDDRAQANDIALALERSGR